MATSETFKVSKRGMDAVEISYEAPESLDDPQWAELVSNPEEDINTLALQALVVKMQAAGRNYLEEGPDAVQEAVNSYKFGARTGGGGRRRSASIDSDTVENLGFSEEQLEALRAAGVSID